MFSAHRGRDESVTTVHYDTPVSSNACEEFEDLGAADDESTTDDDETSLFRVLPTRGATKHSENTFNFDQAKRDLHDNNNKLEKAVDRSRSVCDSPNDADISLEEVINTEAERANSELDRFMSKFDKLRRFMDSRDRELAFANTEVTRLEDKVRELEMALDSDLNRRGKPGKVAEI